MMERPEYEGFYGGAAGGGKTDFLLAEALRQVHIPHYTAIIFRKTYPQLSEIIDRSKYLYKATFPKAKYNESKHVWVFPSGAKIYFGNMTRAADRTNYQGKHYDFIGFDELTHFTWDEYSYLYSRNRPSGPGTRVYRRATGNPGGIGHGWVKQYFVKAAQPMTPVKTEVKILGPDRKPIIVSRKKIFVPSTVFDNKELLKNDPGYLGNLAMMGEKERDALLYGDWDSFTGQAFEEWRDDPEGYQNQRFSHVIDDFYIPKTWDIYRGFDFGYAKPFSVGWYAIDHDGRMYRIREWYGCTKTPNTGIKLTPQQIAKGILEIEKSDPNLIGRDVIGIADPSIYDRSRGESIGEMMEKCGVYFQPADNTRLAGKMQYHYRLAFDEEGLPMFYVFKSCKEFIRTIPSLVYNDVKVEDIDTDQEDHIYDESRYVMMRHPLNPRKNVLSVPEVRDDPLNMIEKPKQDRYFYRI